MERQILHVDVNNAFLSWTAVHMLKNGSKIDIREIPAIIGGDESRRSGIVLAKSPKAKEFGIKTAETIYQARSKCPQLKIYPSDFKIYNYYSNKLFELLSEYYEKKPYLSELIQVVQAFIWKIGAKLFSPIFQYGAEFLEHSLQEKPEDLYITEGKIIEEIKKDENFTKKIDKILKEYGNGSVFDTQENESINYKNLDLFLALNNTEINVKGNKENNKWKLDITITDIYDFTDLKEFNEYIDDNIIKGFIGSFLNNSAMLSTAFNVINQYNITIKFSDEREI